jgi:hypothetical protein
VFSVCSQVQEVKKRFPGLVFSITSQVWEGACVADIVSLLILRDTGLATSHERISFTVIGSTEAPVWKRRALIID